MDEGERSVREFLERLAARTPTPGGGAAAALAGALGAALGGMVTRFSMPSGGGDAGEERDPRLAGLLERFDRTRRGLADLLERDVEAYARFHDASRMPRGTEEETARRREAMQAALDGAMRVPLEGARICRDLLGDLESLGAAANPNLVSDLGVAAALARAGFEGARDNVRVNLRSLRDPSLRETVARELDGIGREVTRRASAVASSVERALAGGKR